MEVFRVTIKRVILDDGELGISVALPEKYNAVEVLGMLETAKLQVYRDVSPSQEV